MVSDPISWLIPGNTMNEVAFNVLDCISGETDGSIDGNKEGDWLCRTEGDWLGKRDGNWLL